MSILETYLTPFVNGVQTIAERFIQISQFDKTITAEIVEIDPDDKYHYLVSTTGCSRLSVRSFENDSNRYKIKDTVYITIPNGDFSSPNKYIIGKTNKVEYKSSIKSIDDLLVTPYLQKNINDNSIYINNANRYSMIIIEFVPRVTAHIVNEDQVNILLEETAFPFTIKGKRKEETYSVTNIWTTKSLYGNIFNNLISNKLRIILAEMRDLKEVEITWESISKDNIPILTYGGKKTQNTAKLELSDFIYYYGYTPEEFDRNEVDGVTVIQTYHGPLLYCRNSYYFLNFNLLETETTLLLLTEYQNAINELSDLDLSEEERNNKKKEITDVYTEKLNENITITYEDYAQHWSDQKEAYNCMMELQEKYSGEEFVEIKKLWNCFNVKLKDLPKDNNGSWDLQICKRNYLALEEEKNRDIPPFWSIVEQYNSASDDEGIQINDFNYVDTDQYNTLISLVHSSLNYEEYMKIENEYTAEVTAVSEDLSLTHKQYTEKMEELKNSFNQKAETCMVAKTVYDILE